MRLKVEFIDGFIELVSAERVLVNMNSGKLEFVYDRFKEDGSYPLEVISRVTVDNEVIYDHMGRKENHKKEKENE